MRAVRVRFLGDQQMFRHAFLGSAVRQRNSVSVLIPLHVYPLQGETSNAVLLNRKKKKNSKKESYIIQPADFNACRLIRDFIALVITRIRAKKTKCAKKKKEN